MWWSKIYDLWCKRHLFFPKISMNVFSDRNFYNLPTNENFCTSCEFHKNRKKVKIPEIIYVMSSYRDEFLRLKMVSLGVLDVFCTVFECATTSTSKFKILSIFAIFRFLIYGFWPFDHRNVDDFSFVDTKIFFKKYHHKPLPEKNHCSYLALFCSPP